MLTIRHYKIFKKVAETKSMSEAAKQLYISQPTISQTIAEIEKHYDIKLFDRYPKKLYLTAAGIKLLDFVNPLIYSFDNINSLSLNNNWKTPLKLGATHTVAECILSDIINNVNQKTDNIDFYVDVNNTETCENLILDNKLDFAIVEGIIKSKDIVTIPIASDCLIFVYGKNHPFASLKKINLYNLANQNFILRENGSGTRKLFEEQMASLNITYNIKWECANFNAIKIATINNHGIGVISARMIEKELENGELFIVNLKDCIWQRDFYLCYHKSKTLTPDFNLFIKEAISFKINGVKCPLAD